MARKQAAGKKRKEASGAPKPKINPDEVVAAVERLATPLCESEGMELVYVEFRRESVGWVLRLYVDREGGVTLDDCARVSRPMGDLLDVGLGNLWPYHLEVSSPGDRRPLGKMRDFEKFQGRSAVIKTREPIEGQKKFKGILKSTNGDTVHLLMEDKTVTIPFQEIVRAHLA